MFKTERSYRNNVFYEEYETKEEFENRIKELLDKKNALLKKLNIDQDSLDKYISFINLQK